MELNPDRHAELVPGAGAAPVRLRALSKDYSQRLYEISGPAWKPVQIEEKNKGPIDPMAFSPDGKIDARWVDPDVRLVDRDSGELVGYYSRGREAVASISFIAACCLAGSAALTALLLVLGHLGVRRRSLDQSPLRWKTNKPLHILLLALVFAIGYIGGALLTNMIILSYTYLLGIIVISAIFNTLSLPTDEAWTRKQSYRLGRYLLIAAALIVFVWLFGRSKVDRSAGVVQGLRWSFGHDVIDEGPGYVAYPVLMGALSLVVVAIDALVGRLVRRRRSR